MKLIASPWSAAARVLCAAALATATGWASPARAAASPRYGGTLVVELREAVLVLDPAKWKAGAEENAASMQIAGAVFDRLITLDRFGRFQPALATEWSHDAGWRRWQFTLRQGVQFSDGSALTSAEAAGALAELLSGKAVVTVAGSHLAVQLSVPEPDLLEQLASGKYFIYRRAADGTMLGTGPFFVAEGPAASGGVGISRYKLSSNERCWAGRPFVDVLEVNLGVPALRQLFDLQLGKADVVDLSPELVRRATRENLRVWASAPVLLYALQVNGEAPGALEPAGKAKARLGEALWLALDRATMANVLLEKQAEPAASFLPQWLSGYAFLFAMDSDVARAKEMSGALFSSPGGTGAQRATAQPLHLRLDGGGDLTKLIAERVAINARQAGIAVQIQARGPGHDVGHELPAAGGANSARATETARLRLVVWRYSSISERAELDAMVAALELEAGSDEKTFEDSEQLYTREKRLVAERHLIPLVVMPDYIGLGAAVRDWMPEHWGEWHLGDVWLDDKRDISAAPVRQ
ncbi:MAG: ABC transporter substrate-binding protein [Candidatus Acidiferrum sp.]